MARILVVDDNELYRVVLENYLRQRGHEVRLAGDGLTGLKQIQEGGLDLVLSDVEMPGLDGLGLAQAVGCMEASRRPPLVLMTGRLTPEVRARAQEAGVVRIVSKPFTFEDLASELAGWLALPRQD